VAHADVTEGIEHAFMGKDAVGDRQFLDQSIHSVEHNVPRFGSFLGPAVLQHDRYTKP
jgi:hypothetical protein